MRRRPCSQSPVWRTELPGELEDRVQQLHQATGRQLLPRKWHEVPQYRQWRKGDRVQEPRCSRGSEILLDWRQREQGEHQVAQRPVSQQCGVVTHRRVSPEYLDTDVYWPHDVSELDEPSLTTGRGMRPVWPCSTTSTTMGWSSTMCPVTIPNPSSVRHKSRLSTLSSLPSAQEER